MTTVSSSISPETRLSQIAGDYAAEQAATQKAMEKERKSPYKNWYQVNNDNQKYIRALLKKYPVALDLLLFMIEHMDGLNALAASYTVFEEALECSRSTVKRALKYLKDHGYVAVYKMGTSNVYVINNELVWKSYGKNQKYCKFPASVMLSYSEQETNVQLKKDRPVTVTLAQDPNEEDTP